MHCERNVCHFFENNCSSISHIMSHSHSLWSALPPFLLPQHTPSLLHPSHSDEQPLDPRTAGRSGRLAVQSPLSGYEPNTTVKISSAEVPPIHLPSRRASFCSVNNSGQGATTTPGSSEVDERQSMGVLASPLLMQKREASAAPARTKSLCWRKFHVKLSSHI